jgi:hypothetical protein
VYCTEPQTILLSVDPHDRLLAEIDVPASDAWQDQVVPASRLRRSDTAPPPGDWTGVGMLRLLPKPGSDLTKILFADFRWVRSSE